MININMKKKKKKQISLSVSTTMRRMADDLMLQLDEGLINAPCTSLAIDESTEYRHCSTHDTSQIA